MPNKSSPAYWHDRKVQYDESLGKDEKRLYNKLAAYYEREAARLDKEIAAYYAKYSVNGVLSYRNLLETLPDEDKLLLIEQLDEFVKKYPAYSDLVPVRESIYKLNRLEGLRQSIAMQQLHMGAYEQQQALAFFQHQALRYANGAASFLGLGSSFCRLDSDVIRAAVGNKWCDGKDFSERIWDNRKKLGNTLHTQFVNGVIRGDDYHQLARQIRAKFVKVSQKNAERLTFTEDTYLSNEAAMQVFEREAAVTEYEFVCTGDAETCDICRGLSGERFPISQRMPGTNFPPMHPWCRCFFDPVIPEKKTLTSGADSGIIKIEFETPESMQKHYAKHGEEYGDISIESYVSLANELVNVPASDDVEKIVRSDGSTAIYRFSTNDFLVVTKDGSIRTFFKPKNGKEYWAYEHERN
nr:MAG TPA: minor capsid protein [Caudoviricetes sp.]